MEANLKINLGQLKKDFPTFQIHEELVYLDSAASTLRPEEVSKMIYEYGAFNHANIHRGAYSLSYEATKSYDQAKANVADFIGAKAEEIIFTYGTTDSLNFVSQALAKSGTIAKGDQVVISIFEHHSNIVPWQQVVKEKGATLKYLYDFDENSLNTIDENTKVVSVALVSNSTGVKLPVERIIQRARQVGAIIILDAAQYVGHEKLDVKALDADFVAFSGHKMFGPTGIGVLYGKAQRLKELVPYRFGGDMIEYVREQETTFAPIEEKFEAGTPNIDGVIGLSAAVDYINKIGIENIGTYLDDLRDYAYEELSKMEEVTLIDEVIAEKLNTVVQYGPVISFMLKDAHPHDVASILDDSHIGIRAGHHCAQPLMKHLGQIATCRISLQVYNNKEDIDYLISKLREVRRWLGYES